MAVSSDAPLVFHPSGSVIQAFHLHEGSLQRLLRGHIDTVNACCYNPITQVHLTSTICISLMLSLPAGPTVVGANYISVPDPACILPATEAGCAGIADRVQRLSDYGVESTRRPISGCTRRLERWV